MDFDFTDEQYAFRDSLRDFLERECPLPNAQAPQPTSEASTQTWAGLAQLGLFSMLVPGSYEGLGLDFVDLSLVIEELGRGLISPAVLDTLVATDIIALLGSDEQKRRLLPAVSGGLCRVALALLEAEAGYDPEDISARITGADPHQRLTGRKILVTAASEADLLMIACRPGAGRPPVLLLIEREREGVTLREHKTLDSACPYYEISLDNVSVSRRDFLGISPAKDVGGQGVARLLDTGALVAATYMTGTAGGVLDIAVDYLKQRTQFGKIVGSFQAIKHRCADLLVTVDACRSAAYYAAWALAHDAPERTRAVSIAKSFCGDGSRTVCNEGIQLHGGMGFTWDAGLHFFLRRTKMLEYGYGDATYHRRRVIAETLTELGVGAPEPLLQLVDARGGVVE